MREGGRGAIDHLHFGSYSSKVEKSLKGSLDLILSSLKIQIMEGKVCLECKGTTLLGVVTKLLKTKDLLTAMFSLITSCKLSC